MASKKGAQGLRLTLPGAPNTAHTVRGYRGHFWPNKLTPVGEPGEVPLDRAKDAHKDPGTPLALEDMSASEATARRKEIAEAHGQGAEALAALARDGEGVDAELARDELADMTSAAPSGDDTKENT